jgi:hypothetical protein
MLDECILPGVGYIYIRLTCIDYGSVPGVEILYLHVLYRLWLRSMW